MSPKLSRLLRALAPVAAIGGAIALVASPASGQRQGLAMFDTLERGGWELRVRGDPGASRKVCLGNGSELIQLRHNGLACDHVTLTNTAGEVAVQYTCPGKGYGRTVVRRETSRLIQIDSQGIENGLPFAFAAEARWSGRCGG